MAMNLNESLLEDPKSSSTHHPFLPLCSFPGAQEEAINSLEIESGIQVLLDPREPTPPTARRRGTRRPSYSGEGISIHSIEIHPKDLERISSPQNARSEVGDWKGYRTRASGPE